MKRRRLWWSLLAVPVGLIPMTQGAQHATVQGPAPNWYAMTMAKLQCPVVSARTGSLAVQQHDLTDGIDEVIVTESCPTLAEPSPVRSVVFDVSGAQPKPMSVLGGDYYFSNLKVSPGGTMIRLDGATVSGDDPMCCAAHHAEEIYVWDGTELLLIKHEEYLN